MPTYIPWSVALWQTTLYAALIFYANRAVHITYTHIFTYFAFDEFLDIHIFYILVMIIVLRGYFAFIIEFADADRRTDYTLADYIQMYMTGRPTIREH